MHSALHELQKRGLIHQSSDIDALSDALYAGVPVYCGFDPTADSLHLGSLLALHIMSVLQEHQVPVIALVGGGTGLIGDPSFKAKERPVLPSDVFEKNLTGIKNSIHQVLGNVTVVNNAQWLSSISVLDFLRDYGKYASVNNMLTKDSVRSRIERDESGISFAEFSYSLLQGIDFEHLSTTYGGIIQIGGSDQWGNMVSGLDLIRRKNGKDVHAGMFTFPLLTKADGTKFGKSESGTIWLDSAKTSAYEFMQYIVNCSDEDVQKMFQYFCNEDNMIRSLDIIHMKKAFAYYLSTKVHGIERTDVAVHIQNLVMGNEHAPVLNDAFYHEMKKSNIPCIEFHEGYDIIDVLNTSGLAPSRKMAREHCANGAARINNTKIKDMDLSTFSDEYFILRVGKQKMVAVHIIKGYYASC